MKRFRLSRQALLFDSPLYIVKAFVSMLTAYMLFKNHGLIGRDMISVLFGMMLTLEPVAAAGLKSAWEQVAATLLGGVTAAVLVAVFGVNAVTAALAVSLTLFIALKINWRFVPPVAIFTAIYMTQYIQTDAAGAPSMLLTLRLRLVALTAGIVVAMVYNGLFSLFFYKGMLRKRTLYVTEALLEAIALYRDGSAAASKNRLTALFGDIDLVRSHTGARGASYAEVLGALRDMTHYILNEVMSELYAETSVEGGAAEGADAHALDYARSVLETGARQLSKAQGTCAQEASAPEVSEPLREEKRDMEATSGLWRTASALDAALARLKEGA